MILLLTGVENASRVSGFGFGVWGCLTFNNPKLQTIVVSSGQENEWLYLHLKCVTI